MRKKLALLLSIIMVIGLFSFPAHGEAAEGDTPAVKVVSIETSGAAITGIAPVLGETPDTSGSFIETTSVTTSDGSVSNGYGYGITWQGALDAEGRFMAGIEYTAEITLNANGERFNIGNFNAVVDGEAAMITLDTETVKIMRRIYAPLEAPAPLIFAAAAVMDAAVDISAAGNGSYYFKYAASSSTQVPFNVTASGKSAAKWESSAPGVASVDASTGTVTAVSPGGATITALDAADGEIASANVFVPSISEDFEGRAATEWKTTAPTDLWDMQKTGTDNSPTANAGIQGSNSFFGVVKSTSGFAGNSTNFFEFATISSVSNGRGVQKNFTPVSGEIIELDFDWNNGTLDRNLTWLSVKDSEFNADTTGKKGLRYLSLITEKTTGNIYGLVGGRDADATNTNNAMNPSAISKATLFTGAVADTWYNVHMTLNTTTKLMSYTVTPIGNPSAAVTQSDIAFPEVDGVTPNNFGSVAFISRGAGTNTGTSYAEASARIYLDNFRVYSHLASLAGGSTSEYNLTVTDGTIKDGTNNDQTTGKFEAGVSVSVIAEEKAGHTVTGWTTVETLPSALVFTKSGTDPLEWSFAMPESNITVKPTYTANAAPPAQGGPVDISAIHDYYFKSDFYSKLSGGTKPSDAPTVDLVLADADTWTSDSEEFAISGDDDGDKTTVTVKASSTPGASAIVTGKTSAGAEHTVKLYVPLESESFDNAGSDIRWGIPGDATSAPGNNTTYQGVVTDGTSSAAQMTNYGIITMSGTDKAFVFSSGRGSSLFRGVQKNFTPSTSGVVELNLDWNVGQQFITGRDMWLSVKNSEVEKEATIYKGLRYLVLRAEYLADDNLKISYGSGGRDDKGTGNGEAPSIPTNDAELTRGVAFNTVYNVNVKLDFARNKTTFTLTNKANAGQAFSKQIDFPAELIGSDKEDFGSVSIIFHGASADNVSDITKHGRMYIDNFNLYGYEDDSITSNTVTVTNGKGSGSYMEFDTVTVTADNGGIDRQVTGWTKTPEYLDMTQNPADPYSWTFSMPNAEVTLAPVFAPYSVSGDYDYYMKSDYFSAYTKPGSKPSAQFTVTGASVWSSGDETVATVSGSGANATITAQASGYAEITAKNGSGETLATIKVYVPVISESFENSPDSVWDVPNNASPSSNQGLVTNGTNFKHGVVVYPAASGNHAFEFGNGRGGNAFRGLQKRFTPVEGKNITELEFDWSADNIFSRRTWISILDSEFAGDGTNEKGFRYLSLKTENSGAGMTLHYDTGGRDTSPGSDGNGFSIPASSGQNALFNRAVQPQGTVFRVHVTLDYINEKTTFSVVNMTSGDSTGDITVDFPEDLIAAGSLDFGAVSIISNGASGDTQNLTDYTKFDHTRIDNFNVYGYNLPKRTLTLTGAVISGGTETVGDFIPGQEVTVTVNAAVGGQAFREWQSGTVSVVPVRDSVNTLNWKFKMPAEDLELTAVYDKEFELSISGQTPGGAGWRRDVTVVGDTAGKYLLVKMTKPDGSVSESLIPVNAEESPTAVTYASAVVSYQLASTEVEVMLTDASRSVITSVSATE